MQLFEHHSLAVKVYCKKVNIALLNALVTKIGVPRARFSIKAETGCSYFIGNLIE